MHLTPNIEKAIQTAAQLHEEQHRKVAGGEKGRLPYVTHLFSVAWILREHTDDEDVIITGLLHDVLEDVDPARYDEGDLRDEFGDRVTRIVKEVSEDKDGTITQEEAEATWQERKDAYFQGLREDSREGLLVCAADKIHNTRSLIADYKREGDDIWQHFNAGKDKKIWYYERVLHILDERLDSPIVDELDSLLDTLKELVEER